MQDTLNRRIRFAPPQPLHEKLNLKDSDLKIFAELHQHGPLPTHYIHRYVKPISCTNPAVYQLEE